MPGGGGRAWQLSYRVGADPPDQGQAVRRLPSRVRVSGGAWVRGAVDPSCPEERDRGKWTAPPVPRRHPDRGKWTAPPAPQRHPAPLSKEDEPQQFLLLRRD